MFIEEQVRLCLDKGDYIRAQILSRKINAKSFDEIVKAEKKAAFEAAKKAGEDVSQMDLDKDMTEEERAKEEKKKNATTSFESTSDFTGARNFRILTRTRLRGMICG